MRLLVVSVGRLRAPYADDVAHYEKLLSRYARLESVEVRDADAVPRRLPSDGFVSLLDAAGSTYDSRSFARFIAARRESGRYLTFVIGGAMGLVLPGAEHRLSLGSMTLPHQLARVVLLEQLYRAHKIILGEPYHY